MTTIVSLSPMLYFRSLFFLRKSIVLVFPFATYISKVGGAYIQSCNNEGMFTMSFDNGSWGCVPCRNCPDGYKITQPCRYNSDTVCKKCPPETYVIESGNECEPCSRCQPGYYVDKQCDAQGDRSCKACPGGYYSRHWNSLSCRRCRRCKQTEKVIKLCNGRNNSICGGCDKDHYREASTWDCVPCSKCEGEDYVRVKECQEKLGDESYYLCQPQIYIYRNNESMTTFVKTSKDNSRTANIEALIVTIPAVTVIAVVVVMLFIITIVTWRCQLKSSSVTRRYSNTEKHAFTSYVDIEVSPLRQLVDETECKGLTQFQPDSDLDDNKNNNQSMRIASETNKTCTPIWLNKAECQHKETDFLLNNQDYSSQSGNHKKKKRKLRREIQSDCDILQNNRFAVLEASKYTTV